MHGSSYALARYKEGQFCGADAFSLLMLAYREAILGCNARNDTHAMAGIEVLIEHLEKDKSTDLVQYLSRSYEVCISLIKLKRFEIATALLQALRESWQEAHEQFEKTHQVIERYGELS